MELEEYIDLERRVSGRMVLLDISATGEENLIEHQSGDQMNDLEYRRKQLTKLQDAVIDLEDLSTGVSITDLTLNDFRMDLARVIRDEGDALESLPLGTFAVTTAAEIGDTRIPRELSSVSGRRPRPPAAPSSRDTRWLLTTSSMSATMGKPPLATPRPSRFSIS